MNAMQKLLLRIPISMNEELDAIASDLWCSKSSFIRQSILRNLDLVKNIEMPLLRQYQTETTLRMLQVAESLSKNHR